MKLRYLMKISLKNLFSNRMRTFITLGGVIIGVGSIVFLVSLGFGLQRLVTGQVATLDEMKIVDVTPGDSEILRLGEEQTEKIEGISNVDKSGKMINTATRIHYESSVTDGVAYGVDNEYIGLSGIKADKGRIFSSQEADEIVVNRAILNLLNTDESIIGKTLKFDFIITSELLDKDGKKLIGEKELTVVGVEETINTPTVYLPISILKDGGAKYLSSVKVQVQEKEQAEQVRGVIENMGFRTEYVGDTVNQIDQVFDIFKIVLAAFGTVALVVAALGMFNTLTVSLLERIREVGLLKALGMSRSDIRKLFLSEALVIGVGGGLLGIVFGLLVGFILNYAINALAQASGADPVTFFYTPWYFAVGIGVFSVFLGVITGIYPAYRAVKINALDALRYE